MKKNGLVDYLNRRQTNNDAQAAVSLTLGLLLDRIEGVSYNAEMQVDTDLLICKRYLEQMISDLDMEDKEIHEQINSILAAKGLLCE